MKIMRQDMANTLPAIGYSDFKFDVQRSVSRSASGGRLTNIIEYADPRWLVTATTRGLRYSDAEAFKVWWQQFRGGLKSAIIRSPYYCRPIAHIHNRGPEQTPGRLSKIEGSVLTVSDTQPGLVLSPGDYLSFHSGDYYALAQVLETSGTGTTKVITVEPVLPEYIETGATVYFDRAEILMRPVWDSFDYTDRPLRSFTFSMLESRL